MSVNETKAKQALIDEFHYEREDFEELEVSCIERLAFERKGEEVIDRTESRSQYGQEVADYIREMKQ